MPKVSTPIQWNSEFGAEELQGSDKIGFCADELGRKPIQSKMHLLLAQRVCFLGAAFRDLRAMRPHRAMLWLESDTLVRCRIYKS